MKDVFSVTEKKKINVNDKRGDFDGNRIKL
jgi:hypothetical protein